MERITYNDVGDYINNNLPFRGNSITAIITDDEYIVYSYNTVIYSKNIVTNKVFFNEEKYSTTTSRLQNIIRREVI